MRSPRTASHDTLELIRGEYKKNVKREIFKTTIEKINNIMKSTVLVV